MDSDFYIIKLKDGTSRVKEIKDNPKLSWATEYYCLTSPVIESYKKILGVDSAHHDPEHMTKVCEKYLFGT